jgi:hypothetical protein
VSGDALDRAQKVWNVMRDEPDTTGKLDVLAEALEKAEAEVPMDLIEFLQEHRRKTLRAIRASTMGGTPDYWRWQGHAELSRQLLERLGAEVPS